MYLFSCPQVSVDGENVKVTDMFDELLSLTELKV